MSRFFYTKPHHALLMAIDHGMRFHARYRRFDGIIDGGLLSIPELTGYVTNPLPPTWDGKIYIHPSSVSQLKPMVYDLILTTGDEVRYVPCIFDEAQQNAWVDTTKRIIERRDAAFFWPEREAA